MAEAWKSPGDEWAAPLLWVLSALLTGAACLFLLLFSLCQPTINPNPGVAAYMPPPGTLLLPLSRRSDAPELADLPAEPSSALPAEPSSALSALAQAQTSAQQPKRDVRPPARKRPRVDPRSYDQGRFGFDQHWN